MKKKILSLLFFILVFLCFLASCNSPKEESTPLPKESSSVTVQGIDKLNTSVDYNIEDNWLSLPKTVAKDVDVIYFYPTSYRMKDGEDVICDITDEGMRKGANDIFQKQATVFSESCNVYAPYYRQTDANFIGTLTEKEMDALMGDVAKADPFTALDYYFQHENNGRPFILAGHSQGSIVLTTVLSQYMKEHSEYFNRMVAAYVIGFSVTEDYLAANPHLKFAEGSDDTGVIISYNTEAPENANAKNLVVREGAISINPLNWKLDDTYAGIQENKGSLVKDGDTFTLGLGIADAKVDTKRGVVLCSSADMQTYASKTINLFGEASFHGQDYGFYYKNLQENIKTRIDSYMKTVQE